MGEVYRARDQQLGREVAIKLLPTDVAHDPERLRRFAQEARATAATNHPNILAIFDIGTYEDSPFIVSELLSGMTLRERLLSGPLPPKKVAEIGAAIAAGLAAAHDRGIVHRDIKPENLFLTKNGHVKVLDFGIAKLTGRSDSDDANTSLTAPGVTVGTVTYMSPEQLCGAAVDHRSDLFSLGSVLYEMITGKPPFLRENKLETMRAILDRDPLQGEAAAKIPPALQGVLCHCLQKDVALRFQSAADLAFSLQDSLKHTAVERAPSVPLRSRWPLVALLALLAIAAALLVARWGTVVPAPRFQRLTFKNGTVAAARFGGDGRTVVYSAAWEGAPLQVYSTTLEFVSARDLGLDRASLLAVSRTGELALTLRGRFGPHLAVLDGTLARVPMEGGAPRELLENVRWADWDDKDRLAVVHQVGGTSRLEYPIGKVLYQTSGWISHVRFSPKGDHLAFIDHPLWSDDKGAVRLLDLSSNTTVLSGQWEAVDGLAWARNDEVWVSATKSGLGRALYAITSSGKDRLLLRVPGSITIHDVSPRDGRALISLDDEREVIRGGRTGEGERDLSWFDWSIARDLSRDGNWLLFEEDGEAAGGGYVVGVRKLDGSPPIRLGEGLAGGLSPDGKWAVTTTGDKVRVLPTGVGQSVEVAVPGLRNFGDAKFHPDGRRLLLNARENGHSDRTYLVDLEGGNPVPVTPEGTVARVISPDGKRVAARAPDGTVTIYTVGESTPTTVPNLPAGFDPAGWSADGKSLYVAERGKAPSNLYRVEIATGKRELLRTLGPRDAGGLLYIGAVITTPDANTYAYSYYRGLSVLYAVENLK
jgi:eukaryotic-like serine/threonine-protein kinase